MCSTTPKTKIATSRGVRSRAYCVALICPPPSAGVGVGTMVPPQAGAVAGLLRAGPPPHLCVVAFDADFVDRLVCLRGWAMHLSRRHVVLGAVPGAGDGRAVQLSL